MIRIMGGKKIGSGVGFVRRVRSVDAINAFRDHLSITGMKYIHYETWILLTRNSWASSYHCIIRLVQLFIIVEKFSMRSVHGFLGVYKTLAKRKMHCTKFILKKKRKKLRIGTKNIKNKLTSIIRACKKEHYKKVLDSNRNDIRGIWKTLNNIIKQVSKHRGSWVFSQQ